MRTVYVRQVILALPLVSTILPRETCRYLSAPNQLDSDLSRGGSVREELAWYVDEVTQKLLEQEVVA